MSTIDLSILIPSFRRAKLLRYGLESLAKQENIMQQDIEVIVLNDGDEKDDTYSIFSQFEKETSFKCKYLFTGIRNKNEYIWRVPGFPINIGAKSSSGDNLLLMCPEIYVLDKNTIKRILEYLGSHEKILVTPTHVFDDFNGNFLKSLESGVRNFPNVRQYFNGPKPPVLIHFEANIWMPYFMAMNRNEFFSIGGYDEDFIGIAADDNDLVERLKLNGCRYHVGNFQVVHLWNELLDANKLTSRFSDPRYQYNVKLWHERKGTIVRNKNREWGINK